MRCVGKRFRKAQEIHVVGEDERGVLVHNVGEPADQWWIDWEVFWKTYLEVVEK